VLLSLEASIPPRRALEVFSIPLLLLVWVPPGLSQKAHPEDSNLPKYHLHTETKTNGVIDEVSLARALVKGSDTLMFRDDKGNPVWDWRTGK